jgi:predicted amidohydrolase YtcJ
MHLAVCNSLGLKELNYTEDTPNPPGGKIDHYPNGTLTGLVR